VSGRVAVHKAPCLACVQDEDEHTRQRSYAVVIALFTDFGTRDAYVAQLKGAILSIHPTAQLVDLTHAVEAFNIRAASYLLEASARYFPARTIFVAVVDPGVGTTRHPLLVETLAGKFYLGPDNGLFTRVLEHEGLHAAYVLTQSAFFRPEVSATFHGRDIFGPVAAHLAAGIAPEQFGPRLETLVQLPSLPARHLGATIHGEVLHIDHYGNIATNIPAALVTDLRSGQRLTLVLDETPQTLYVVATYGSAAPGQLIGLINSSGDFEVALPQGSAARHLAAQVGQQLSLHL